MRCEDARAFISREADGELRDEQKAAARQHVEQCPDCARFLAHCRALQCAIEGSVVDAPSRLYWAGFSKRLSEQATTWVNSTVARMRLYRLVACAAAAACFVLLIGLVAERSLTRRLEAQIARSVASGFEPGAEPQGLVPATPLAAATSQQGLAEQAEAFRLVGDYFQGELAWMVQDGSQSELGLTGRPDATRAAAQGGPLIVEMRLLCLGKNGDARLASAPTLTIVPGVEANFHLSETGGTGWHRFAYRCQYGATPANGPMLSVTVHVSSPAGPLPLELTATVRPGDSGSQPAAYSRQGDLLYVLYVSASGLAERRPDSGHA